MFRWFAKRVLKKELAKLAKYEKNAKKQIYIDEDIVDALPYWKEMGEWAKSPNARRYAFERLNSLLTNLMAVGNTNSQDFYVIQGAMAEMNKFMGMSDNIDNKIVEIVEEREELANPKPKTEQDSISEMNR